MNTGKPLLDAPLTPEGDFWASQEERILHDLDAPASAPRKVVEKTVQHINQHGKLSLIEWITTPAGGFWSGVEYRFVPDCIAGRECWRVDQRRARADEWTPRFHRSTLQKAVARLWQQGCGWWRPQSAIRLWLKEVGVQQEDLSEAVEW